MTSGKDLSLTNDQSVQSQTEVKLLLGSKSSLNYAVSEIFKLMTFYSPEKSVFVSNVNVTGIFLSALGNSKYLNHQFPTLIVTYFSQHV